MTLAAAVLLAVTLGAADAAPANASSRTVSARALLARLVVAYPDRHHKYHRPLFDYDDDYDADGDGCYTRREVLIRDAITLGTVSPTCVIESGTWRSLYDDRVTHDRNSLEVDHLVPLAEAWHAGAWAWSHRRQIAFGNDLGYEWSLQAVTSAVNQEKDSKDPARWLPPKNRCTYVKAWIAVKYRWHLSVDPAEKAVLTRQLDRCASTAVLRPGTPDLATLVGIGAHD